MLRILVLVALQVTLGAAVARAQPMYEQLRIVAPAAPGGGWDQTARVMQQVLQQSGIARTAPVENVPGAAGTIGLARFIGAERGNRDVLMVSGLIMLGGIVTHRSPVTLGDVTPIARLTGEYEVIVVPAASPFHTLQDVIARWRERPESISWGGGSAGGSDQILAGLVADAAGVAPSRINYIAFSGGGESLSAIVGGQVSVGVNGLAELAAQIESGTIRVLGISSGERLPGVDAPTLREQGIDVVFENWRSVVAPPGITPSDRDRLARAVEAMVRSTAWRNALERYRWLDRYLAGEAFAAFAASEESRVRAVLRELGTEGTDDRGLLSAGPYPMFVLAGLVLCAVAAMARPARIAAASPNHAHGTARAGGGPAPPKRARTGAVREGGPVSPKRGRRTSREGGPVSPKRGRRASREGGPVSPKRGRRTSREGGRSLILLGAGAAVYLLSAERAGFVIASAVLFWLTARAFDERHPIRDAVVAISAAIASYLLFARVLQLALPAGILAGWL